MGEQAPDDRFGQKVYDAKREALLDVGVDFAWCQTRFRLLPKPRAETVRKKASVPKEVEPV